MPSAALVGSVLVVAAFALPLLLTGELGVWVLDRPASHLVWDERSVGPGEEAVDRPGVGAALETPLAAFVTLVGLPVALSALTVWVVGRFTVASPGSTPPHPPR